MTDLNSKPKTFLYKLAKKYNINGRSKMSKAELIAALTPVIRYNGGSGASFNMEDMAAALQQPSTAEQEKLIEEIERVKHLAPANIRGALDQLLIDLRANIMKPASIQQLHSQVSKLTGQKRKNRS